IAATGLLLYYTARNLGISTDTQDMLSEDLHFRRVFEDYKRAFPQYDKAILIVVDADTPDLVREASLALAHRLQQESETFKTVYLPGAETFFEQNALLYLTPSELEDLADNLAKVQPFLAKLTRDQSLRGLFSMAKSALEAVQKGEDVDLAPLFDRMSRAIKGTLEKKNYRLSWLELMRGETSSAEERRAFIMAQPMLDYSNLLPGETAVKTIRRVARELKLDQEHGLRIRLTGDIALEYEELQSVMRGAEVAGLMALILVGIVLFAGLRSSRLVLATLVTLLMGLIWTAGFATAAVGHLNLISVAFAVLYIGMAVDFSIHFCLRYKELIENGYTNKAALQETAQDIGISLVLCALTTAIGFYAFIPTAFSGLAELGVISGTGMFISLIGNLTILPALLTLMPFSPRAAEPRRGFGPLVDVALAFPLRHYRAIRIGSLALGLLALFSLSFVSFDRNILRLQAPENESVTTFNELLTRTETSPWSLAVVAPDAESAREYAKRLGELELVDRSVMLGDFVPTEQGQKLATIEEIALILGPAIMENKAQSHPSLEEQVAAVHDMIGSLEAFIKKENNHQLESKAGPLLNELRQYEAALAAEEQSLREQMLNHLELSLLGTLPERLRILRASLSARSVGPQDLPETLTRRWVAEDGRYRVEVFPREDLNDNKALQRFVTSVQKVAPDAIGIPVIIVEAGDAVIRAFRQALILSGIAISLLLLILMRRKVDALLVLLPLLLAGTLTGASTVLLNVHFNFANVIALPLILGVGVDNGIHMVHRMRTAMPVDGNPLKTSTARAVLFSTLTTICSFGNLALSPHRGMASMGLLLSIGIGFILLCTLIVLPALLYKRV
ncbi:MAG: efflux RND transporter permease subunit, partial [Pseudomonadota bacterium]